MVNGGDVAAAFEGAMVVQIAKIYNSKDRGKICILALRSVGFDMDFMEYLFEMSEARLVSFRSTRQEVNPALKSHNHQRGDTFS